MVQGLADVKNGRDRWSSRSVFILAAVGSSIGLGNIWKFPYLTFKHGGVAFIIAYLIAFIIVGMPMLILELTLGQKMQRGSAGCMRGISPRMAGVGWAASFVGFITCIIYNILLGMCLLYLFTSGGAPWSEHNIERPFACKTAEKVSTPPSELFLYMNVTSFLNPDNCQPWSDGATNVFGTQLFVYVCISWVICFLCIMKGAKSINYVVLATSTLPFIFLFMLIGKYVSLNSSEDGKGISFYFGGEDLVIPGQDTDGSANRGALFADAYNQVFFSVGVCVGVFQAYGSYNHVKKPVIRDAFLIGMLDLVFAVFAGFITWSAIGYLEATNQPTYNQTSSVGLTFIAFPHVADLATDGRGWFALFCFALFVAGIDSAFSYIEGLVANIVDEFKWNRTAVAGVLCVMGAGISATFTSSIGWILFDMVDHYISSYFVVLIGFLQCVAVGWVFEHDTTAIMSPGHKKSLKWMGFFYWIPVICINFYA